MEEGTLTTPSMQARLSSSDCLIVALRAPVDHRLGGFPGRWADSASNDLLSVPALWLVTKCLVRSKAILEALASAPSNGRSLAVTRRRSELLAPDWLALLRRRQVS